MKLGWRLAGVGFMSAALFGVLGLRLWYLQVSTIDVALQTAQLQQIRVVQIEPPRGDILAADGAEIMAGTVASLRLVVDRQLVPEERSEELLRNLAALLDLPASEIRQRVADAPEGSRFTVGGELSEQTAAFVLEHIEDFPGVAVEPRPVRIYPLGETAAHVVGYIGFPGEDDLGRQGITQNDKVGRFGVEKSYDALLRGTPGKITYRVNARGEILGVLEETPPVPGGSVVTTIDVDLQEVVESSLIDGMRVARLEGEFVQRASSVVIDVTDGSVLAMASVPSFDPTLFVDGRISESEWAEISESFALNNFAIQGLYPPASAFKVVPYTLAIEEGIYPQIDTVYATKPESVRERYKSFLSPANSTDFFADGVLIFPETPPLKDWICRNQGLVTTNEGLVCPRGGHGVVDIHSALHRSSNQYFWGVALEIWNGAPSTYSEDLLQQWARVLGFGSRSGIDLPFEQSGVVPDRDWFVYHQNNNTGLVRLEGGWSGGDVMNIAIGQGSLTATPLQLANAYATLANGGTLWRPRVVDSIRDGEGNVLFVNTPSVTRKVDISPATVRSLLTDLNGVITIGTAAKAFEDFGDSLNQVGGKTGTGQTGQYFTVTDDTGKPVPELDEDGKPVLDDSGEPVYQTREAYHAWFAGVAPLDSPQYAVVVIVDQGGSGGQVAAPTARRIMQYLMGEQRTPITPGSDSER